MLLLLLACGLTGGPAVPNAPAASSAPSPAKDTLDRVKVSTDLAALRESVRRYRMDHDDTNPPSLDDIGVSGLNYLGYYEYNPMTGDVTCPEHPAL